MSIMPEGGWGDLVPREKTDTPESATSHTPVRRYLSCKVCDRGTLSAKRAFRLGGPAVAIGYILLIPSVLGMVSCAVMLIAVNVGMITLESNRPLQSTFDATFRRNCSAGFRNSYLQASGLPASQSTVEGVCECALAAYKETGSEGMAVEACTQKALDGTLDPVGQDVDALYSGSVPRASAKGKWSFLLLLHGLTTGYLVALGVAFFVSGLLGWLLVMKKHVLQCDLCSAVINAS